VATNEGVGLTVPGYEGRLELTWTNKPLRLLAHEDGSYEWLEPADYRVAEVRLLHEVASVGAIGKRRAADNLLIRGDALHALTSLSRLPEFAREYVGKIKLAYLDPPFNTQEAFTNYDDALEHSVWLTMMRDRLIQVRELLAPEGSIWVHCDDNEQHRLRSVMDEVFGPAAFIATVIWQKRYSRDNRPAIGPVHDYLHVYAPLGTDWKRVRNRIPRDTRSMRQYRNPNNDPRGAWRPIPLDVQAGHATASQFYDVETPGGATRRPAPGRAWSVARGRLDQLISEGRVYFGADGRGMPNLIRYLDEDEGLVPWTWWPHEEVGHTDEAKKEILDLFPDAAPFDTPKPERLISRVVHIATNPDDIVLDCFLGSGTTAGVAHKMGRRWVGIEWSRPTVEHYAYPRLQRVVHGTDPGGITTAEVPTGDGLPDGVKAGETKVAAKVLNAFAKSGALDDFDSLDTSTLKALVTTLRAADRAARETLWEGGGGFRLLEVAPSMFEADAGLVFLANSMTNGVLAEATAAQLGFDYEPDPPFVGRKGRTRLAVVDGVVNESVVRLIVSALPDNERVIVCGTGIDTEARPILRDLRPGSTLRKIPAALLQEYRTARRPKADADGRVEAASNGHVTEGKARAQA
jgi:adenine-specific DNA-methyltransferase